ncbi:MAG: DUF4149 domain-containing protein [Acidobacteriota bacterium]|nr:DUF4149 domain-containing protein [Acidobacteriota bacterium]
MQTLLRALRLYAMVTWVGGIAFLSFVLAPIAFGRLASTHEAGLVVGGSLRELHWIGLVGGVLFCLANAWLWFQAEVPARVGFAIQFALTVVMLAGTAYSQFHILPAMAADRALSGLPVDDPRVGDFERLHWLSERVEGLVLVCGLGVVFVLSRESQWPETGKIVRP